MIRRNDTWVLQSRYGSVESHLQQNVSNGKTYATGRLPWTYVDPTCGIDSPIERNITLSICQFGKEFTCDSGHCINMNKRCNYITDCNDGSDENNCILVQIPYSYAKQFPPGNPNSD